MTDASQAPLEKKDIVISGIDAQEVKGALRSRLMQLFRIKLQDEVESSVEEYSIHFDRDVYVGRNACTGFHFKLTRSVVGGQVEWLGVFLRGEQRLQVRAYIRG